MRKDKTLSFFEQRRPDAIEDVLPIVPTAPNRIGLQDLTWYPVEGPTSWTDFVRQVTDCASEDAVFFLDASFLHRHEIPTGVFSALLSKTIAITPLVWGELQDWMANPFANAMFRDVLLDAKENGNSSVVFLDSLDWPDGIRESVHYYTTLLLARKHVGVAFRKHHMEKEGREPSDEELTRKLQTSVGDRGVTLARKGMNDQSKPNFNTDEDLVVAAITFAIMHGRETSILTRDRDPLEQFRKLIYLLDTHYRSFLIAESFEDTPENLIRHDAYSETAYDFFKNGDRCILDLPRRFTEWVLPKEFNPVLVSCERLAGDDKRMKSAKLRFHARCEMLQLLEIKGKSGGRNFAFPDGRNCHLAISPPLIPELGGKAIIASDNIIEFGPFEGPHVDVEYALQEVQRFRKTATHVTESIRGGGTPGMKLADFFLPERLTFCSPPEWRDLSWQELSRAVRFFDGAALFFLDGGVIPHIDANVTQTLLSRGFAWSTTIRDSALSSGVSSEIGAMELETLANMPAFDVSQDAPFDRGFDHYLALLALRRQFAGIIRSTVRRYHGRECMEGEVTSIAEHYGGIRARRIAEHSETSGEDPMLFAGDELLVFGVIAGILEGTDVVFFTRDLLFMDQFSKLASTLAADYVATQFAMHNPFDPLTLPSQSSLTESADPFATRLGQAYLRKLERGWRNQILPNRPYLINLHCWLLGRDDGDSVRFAALTFCAERGMHNLLRLKGATGGCNVEEYGGWNIRANLGGTCTTGANVSMWRDRIIPIGATDFPQDNRLDLRIGGLAAADISRVHSREDWLTVPQQEESE